MASRLSSLEVVAACREAAGCLARNELAAAESVYRRLLEDGHGSASIYSNLAAIQAGRGDLEQAIPLLERALDLEPGHADALANLGGIRRLRGDLPQAEPLLRRALQLSPHHPQARLHLAQTLQELQRPAEAMALLQQLLDRQPHHPQALQLLAQLARQSGRHGLALQAAQQLLALAPHQADAHQLLALVLKSAGRLAEAASHYERAIALRPGFAEAEANLSMILLLQGDYGRGLALREARLRKAPPVQLTAAPALPRWNPRDGGAPQLLVVGEQGLGDMIQFLRYVPLLEQRLAAGGGGLRLCLPDKLQGLARCAGIARSICGPEDLEGQELRLCTHWEPLLSLPYHLGVTPAQPLVSAPYLRIPEEPRRRWAERLRRDLAPAAGPAGPGGAAAPLLVGIHWQGNREQENLIGRSLPLETFAPLAELEGICLLSLQKGYGSEQLKGCRFRHRFHPAQAEVDASWDFIETAAMVLACDLVITSDSALAHLAGGLGVPTWLLLQAIPDWRWGLAGDSTFWYASLRLFRQHPGEAWPAVMGRVRQALAQRLGG